MLLLALVLLLLLLLLLLLSLVLLLLADAAIAAVSLLVDRNADFAALDNEALSPVDAKSSL